MDLIKSQILRYLTDDNRFEFKKQAAVCIVLRKNPVCFFDVLIMRRAIVEGDNWSGQLAYPGGKKDPSDTNLLFTANRECEEEMGFSPLAEGEFWGAISSVQGRMKSRLLDFSIHPFVFSLNNEVNMTLDPAEVDDYFWVSLNNLFNAKFLVQLDYSGWKVPAVKISESDSLWGLSYKMTLDFLKRLENVKEIYDYYFAINPKAKEYLEHLPSYD